MSIRKSIRQSVRNLAASFGPAPLPRLLCLHGYGSNSLVTDAQLNSLGYDKYFQVSHLLAPWECKEDIDEGVQLLSPEGPFYSWTGKKSQPDLSKLIVSLKFVLCHIVREGKYDAVYGFSQGAGIAAILSIKEIRDALLVSMGIDTELNTGEPWKFMFATCPVLPVSLQELAEFLQIDLDLPLAFPTVCVIGTEDHLKWKSEDFLKDIVGVDHGLSLPVYFEGGHGLPQSASSRENIEHAAVKWFFKFNRMWMLPDYDFKPTLNSITTEMEKESSFSLEHHQLKRTDIHYNELNFMSLLMNPELENQIAFRGHGNSSCFTYGEVRDFIKGPANLARAGCQHGDKVAYLAPYGMLGAFAFISIAAQCVAVPLDPDISPNDLKSAFLQLKPNWFIIFDDLGDAKCSQAKEIASNWGIRIINASGKNAPFQLTDEHMKSEMETDHFLENAGSDNCIFLRTSGTTSEPKIVPLKTSNVINNAFAIAGNLGLVDKDIALNAMPLFHIGGLMTNFLASFVSGGSTVFLPKFDVSTFTDALTIDSEAKPTWFSAVPTMLAAIQRCISAEDAQNTSLRFIRVGAAAISDDLIKQSQDTFGCTVIPTYSMSECMPISQPPTGCVVLKDKPGSVGQPLNVSVCIVCSDLVPMQRTSEDSMKPPIGEVCISGPGIMHEYLSNIEANQKAFFSLGRMTWFRTGDLGYLDEDDFLFLTGRKKEMIKVNGKQISPIEVEDACMRFPPLKICVAFSQPSEDAWGEKVGIVCVLTSEEGDAFVDKHQFKTDLQRFLKAEGCPDWKIPKRIEILREEDLPKTRSGKYVRVGLAEKIDKICPSDDYESKKKKSPFHPAAIGVQFVLAVAVMYVHIGNLNYWTIYPDDSEHTDLYQEADEGKEYSTRWSNTRTWCFHTPLFFFVGGFLLAAGAQSSIRDKESFLNFYKVRILSLHPMYLLSVLICTIIMVFRCNPGNYIDEFDRTREPLAGETFVCQATPVEMSWGLTLFTSVMSYSFLLQSWPVAVPISWFLSYYTWFSSVYIFCIFVFPWCHRPFYDARDDRKQLWKLTLAWAVALYVFIGCFSTGLSYVDDEVTLNWFALYAYLFPPGWLPCFSIGIGTYFILKDARTEKSFDNSAWKWGLTTDLMSILLLIGWLIYGLASSSSIPHIIQGSGMAERYWAGYVSRLVCPLGFLWFAGLAIGKGVTAKILSRKTIVQWLAPASYNCFLFHQPLSELYFFATRGVWWAYPKSFYWFSPHPIPVRAWEIPIVMAIVIIFSMIMHFYVNGALVSACTSFLCCCFRVSQNTTSGNANSPRDIVKEVISRVSHTDMSRLSEDTNLAEIGLSSMALPVAISEINSEFKKNRVGITLSSRIVSSAREIGDLMDLASTLIQQNKSYRTMTAKQRRSVSLDGTKRYSKARSIEFEDMIATEGFEEIDETEGLEEGRSSFLFSRSSFFTIAE